MSKRKINKEKQSGTDLENKIKKAVEGLYYTSETDAEITLFSGKEVESVTKEAILEQTGYKASSVVNEKSFEDFFDRLTKIEDWYGDEEKATAQKFLDLKDLLQKELKDLKVFKIGKTEIDIYVVGLDSENKLAGIKTQSVET